MKSRATIVFIIGLLSASPASAYIDPGTGSALFYVITGVVVSIYFGIRSFYYRSLDFLFRIRYRDQRCSMAIHCEDPRYESTFLPVIERLVARGVEPTLFTMYERDGSFPLLPAAVTHRTIAPGMVGYAYLNNLEAKLLVTTTPQLDVMTFRRSRRVRHYAMIQHALGESRYVRPFAYDFFDSVLCCGEIVKKNIRRMEEIRMVPPKILLETGLPHWEELIRSRNAGLPPQGGGNVLVAPSWGPLSMFEAFGTSFVREIARRFNVIVRPHPQMRISQPELYREIVSLPGVAVSTEKTPSEAMSRSDILLSDISGIAHEFAFIYERPVVVIDRKMELGGLEGEILGGDSELKDACKEFIVPIPPEQISSIASHLEQALQTYRKDTLISVRERLVYNFGHASDVAAGQLVELMRASE